MNTYKAIIIILLQSLCNLTLANDIDILLQSNDIVDEATKNGIPDWLNVDKNKYIAKARKLAKTVDKKIPEMFEKNEIPDNLKRIIVYASMSMGEKKLINLFENSSGKDNVFIVFCGLEKKANGEPSNIPDFMRNVRTLIKGISPEPNVFLEPNLFKMADIQVVPTIILLEGENKIITESRGTISLDWFIDKIKYDKGDLGKWGETHLISETNIIDDIKNRLKQIDWEEKKNNALANFWNKQEFFELDEAKKDNEFLIDPSVTADANIYDHKGDIVVAKGTTANPLDYVPLTSRLIVFNGTKEKQIAIAKKYGEELKGKRNVVYITTKIDRKLKWDGLNKIEEILNRPVYLLNRSIVERLKLKKVPSIIDSQDKRILIREIKP